MSDFTQARNDLRTARSDVPVDSPEWIKISAAMAALEDAQQAQIQGDFSRATQRISDAAAKLQALVDSLQINGASALADKLQAILRDLKPLAETTHALLAGEPATALPGTPVDNKVAFREPTEPEVTPPVREFARDLAAPVPKQPDTTTVDRMIDDILRREGGFVDHPNDRGGPTNFGITQRTLEAARGRPVTRDDVRRMDREEARAIYRKNYYSRPHIDTLPALLQPILFDMAINHGPGTAVKLLQEVLSAHDAYRCSIDGGIGKETRECAEKAVARLGTKLVNELVARRKKLYLDIIARDPSQKVFQVGWLKRADEFAVA